MSAYEEGRTAYARGGSPLDCAHSVLHKSYGEWLRGYFSRAKEETISASFNDLKPGQSIKIGCAWDGTFYVVREQTTPGDWLGPVTRKISRGATVPEAWSAEQEDAR